ncbi:metal ABC transporter permease [Rouxiella badensis]|jgi:zinc/manganese transport system permease protein|uniref:metal ABC transporter permease n=2 Tax=Rouxiella badensis TaxID=1646377 RepID=UPI0013EF3F60|nr:metal ABC transporter permease [Rouxiella badensis]MCC3701751.1 metal ABC transporter permease [Rouxiella badensis]MCC3748800.1 metal ABC transporter permease [Rouxiella badensis]QII38469.1 metal ABC transporter permease [Rouxiella badensis]QOI54957.1 metal ABC transporter permease [Rouxiella badensis subsp. acadiensis]WAT10491.1 metal ABC transporter permease [Rouxiella badensis]
MNSLINFIVEPGFFSSDPVQTALIVGSGTAIVSGVVGVFTVIRGQSFAGHALADVSSAGGALSFLLGINPLIGLLGMALLASLTMEIIDIRRARERDLMTGIVLGAGLGLAALLLYFDVTTRSTTGAAVTVMFGSMFAISPTIIPLALWLGGGAVAVIIVIYRPLLLSSLDKELAQVMGIRTRWVSTFYLMLLSLAVTLSAMTVGAVLSTALLIGPAATALRITRRPLMAMLMATILGLVATWGGIVLAYDSFYWTPGHGWPVSFFIVALIFIAYLASTHLIRLKGH